MDKHGWYFIPALHYQRAIGGSHHFSSTPSHVVDSNGKTSSRLSLAAIATETINIHQHPSTSIKIHQHPSTSINNNFWTVWTSRFNISNIHILCFSASASAPQFFLFTTSKNRLNFEAPKSPPSLRNPPLEKEPYLKNVWHISFISYKY